MAGLPWQRGSTRPPGCHSGFPVPATLFVLGRHPGEFEGVREAGGRSSREFTGVRGSRGEPYRLQATQTPCRVSQTAWAAGGVGREQEEGKMEPVRDNPRGPWGSPHNGYASNCIDAFLVLNFLLLAEFGNFLEPGSFKRWQAARGWRRDAQECPAAGAPARRTCSAAPGQCCLIQSDTSSYIQRLRKRTATPACCLAGWWGSGSPRGCSPGTAAQRRPPPHPPLPPQGTRTAPAAAPASLAASPAAVACRRGTTRSHLQAGKLGRLRVQEQRLAWP